jgi:hypothetical protein
MNVEQRLKDLEKAVEEMIVIPNEWLPEEFHDKVRGGRTAARLAKMCEQKESTKNNVKKLKAENVANYRKQLEENGEFEYNGHVDEIQLHKNQMALVGGMFNSGMISKEDLEDG